MVKIKLITNDEQSGEISQSPVRDIFRGEARIESC
jgi:hypothetical protein